jgi:hypothetical protein
MDDAVRPTPDRSVGQAEAGCATIVAGKGGDALRLRSQTCDCRYSVTDRSERGRATLGAWTPENDGCPDETDRGARNVPPIGTYAFNPP